MYLFNFQKKLHISILITKCHLFLEFLLWYIFKSAPAFNPSIRSDTTTKNKSDRTTNRIHISRLIIFPEFGIRHKF